MFMEQRRVEEHFDEVAKNYDYWKSKNWFYYKNLQDIARSYTVSAKSVLDAGCGTGTILKALNVPKRLGVDISGEMIEIAKKRHTEPNIDFIKGDIADINVGQFDVVIFFDVIEHVQYPEKILAGLYRSVNENGIVVISMANPLWEGILMVAEKLHMKMPEGPHYRISAGSLINIAKKQRLQLVGREWRLLFPKYIPLVSFFINDVVGKIPFIERLACVEVFVFERSKTYYHED